MKNLTMFAVLFAFVLLASQSASAAVCGDIRLNHPASETVDPVTFATTTISAVNFLACGGGSPELVQNVWGGTNSSVPHVLAGATVRDEAGVASTCPEIVARGCVDITHTEYYRGRMRALVQQLSASGFLSQFPNFLGWVGR